MEWYEVILGVVMFIIGTFISIKIKGIHKGKYHNDSWRGRKK
jgi:hypothetical protein